MTVTPVGKSVLIALFLLLFFAPRGAHPEEKPHGELFSPEMPVEITADSITYDRAADRYHASGNVEIAQEGISVRADTAILDMAAGVGTVSGNIRAVDEGGSALTGNTLQFNIRDKTAVLANGRLFYREGNIHLTADSIRKTGPESYAAERVTYTTCDCPPEEDPDWSFAATSARVTVGQYLTGWNARFYIKGVPVLYSPYISIPIKRERQSGFLQPRPGFSELRGFILDTSYFWAIARNQDATFYLDVESRRGLGKGAEYRYIRTRKSSGEIFFYQFQEKSIERVREFRQDVDNLSRPEEATDNRWRLRLVHRELFDSGLNLRANLNLVSDDEYFIDFGRGQEERSLEALESNLSASFNRANWSLVGQMRFFDNLLDADDDETLQRLPEITLTSTAERIAGTPFYFSSQSSYVNFWREEGLRGQRLDIRPRLSMPVRPGGYFDFLLSAGPAATLWFVERHPEEDRFDRFTYDVTAELTTTFVRVFRAGQPGATALRHTLRPGVAYVYAPDISQDDLPSFDDLDRISAANSISYSLNSTLTGRSGEGDGAVYFEYLYLDLRQSYNFHEAERELAGPGDERRPFSDVTGELIVRPLPLVTGVAKGTLDVYESHFTAYEVSLAASDKRGDSLAVSHRFVKDGANYLEGSLRARLPKGVDFTFLKRFSFDERRSLETSYGLEYFQQCWSATLTYTERLEEKLVYLTFNLLGLGRVAGVQGRLEH